MLLEYDPVARLILGSEELLICIIIVGKLPEGVACVLDEVRGGFEGILLNEPTPICMFIHTVRDINPG